MNLKEKHHASSFSSYVDFVIPRCCRVSSRSLLGANVESHGVRNGTNVESHGVRNGTNSGAIPGGCSARQEGLNVSERRVMLGPPEERH